MIYMQTHNKKPLSLGLVAVNIKRCEWTVTSYSLVEANPRIHDEWTTEFFFASFTIFLFCFAQVSNCLKRLVSVDSVNVLVGYLRLITSDSYQNMTGSQYDDNNSQSWSSAEQSTVPRSSVALQNICNFVGLRQNIWNITLRTVWGLMTNCAQLIFW